MLFYRAILASAFNVIWLNRHLKYEMYDSVKKDLVCQLIFKVIHGNIQFITIYASAMYWPLTTASAARLAIPFMTFILACVILQEFAQPRVLIYTVLIVSFASMIIFNTESSDLDNTRIEALGSASIVAYLVLFGEPMIVACGQVLTRSLRRLSNMTVSCYTNLSAIFVQFIWVYIAGHDFYAYQNFTVFDTLALTAASIMLVFMQTLSFTALQNMPTPVL